MLRSTDVLFFWCVHREKHVTCSIWSWEKRCNTWTLVWHYLFLTAMTSGQQFSCHHTLRSASWFSAGLFTSITAIDRVLTHDSLLQPGDRCAVLLRSLQRWVSTLNLSNSQLTLLEYFCKTSAVVAWPASWCFFFESPARKPPLHFGMLVVGRTASPNSWWGYKNIPSIQAGPAKTLKIDKYRCAPLSFSSSDLKF